jgi:hypothetical protein
MIQKDGSGNDYIEVRMPNGEAVRISQILNGWDGGKCLRISIVQVDNRVRQGPEFPVSNVQGVIDALNKLK